MISELEFDETERNEFLIKMNMIRNAEKVIQHRREAEHRKKQAVAARRKTGAR